MLQKDGNVLNVLWSKLENREPIQFTTHRESSMNKLKLASK